MRSVVTGVIPSPLKKNASNSKSQSSPTNSPKKKMLAFNNRSDFVTEDEVAPNTDHTQEKWIRKASYAENDPEGGVSFTHDSELFESLQNRVLELATDWTAQDVPILARLVNYFIEGALCFMMLVSLQ